MRVLFEAVAQDLLRTGKGKLVRRAEGEGDAQLGDHRDRIGVGPRIERRLWLVKVDGTGAWWARRCGGRRGRKASACASPVITEVAP